LKKDKGRSAGDQVFLCNFNGLPMVGSELQGFEQLPSAELNVKPIFEVFFLCTKLNAGAGEKSLNPKNLLIRGLARGPIHTLDSLMNR
jgi:hypothetical protein